MPYPGSTNPQLNHRTMADPYVEYQGERLSFSLKNRFYRSYTNYNNEDFGLGLMYYTEAQARYRPAGSLGRHLRFTGGLVQQTGQIRSDRLYGNQQTVNRSIYSQVDWQKGRLEAGLGARGEWFLVNGSQKLFQPVVRGGLNFAYSASGNLRASAGQGFRSPSVAEMYSNTFVGSVRLASDPQLNAELSRSIELGIHQRFNIGKLLGYFDLAWFQTRYDSMIEYSFGVYIPPVWDSQDSIWLSEGNLGAIAQKYARFQPANIVEARISGLEAVVGATGRWGHWGVRWQAGYTYTLPINLKPATNPRADTSGLSELVDLRKYLKYRYLHLLRTDLAVQWKSWILGVNTRYNSVILNIDEDFYRFMPGLIDYRIRSIKGDLLTDLRLGRMLYRNWQLSLVVRNLGNRSWMPLPGNIGEQRNAILQLTGRF
jgi:iron complex outermembrane receptor protein